MQKNWNKAENSDVTPLLLPASGFPRFSVFCGINRHLSVFSPSFHDVPLVPSGAGERGLLWGRCPPSRPLSNPPNHPPYLALRLCVHCPPVPTKASLSEQAGAHIHPRMGGGMKSGQGCYPSCVPRPAVGGIAGVRVRPENPQTLGRAVRREGCRYDVGLGRAPPCDPVSASPSVPKAKLLLEHEDAGRTGRRSTLKGKGDSGGGCKEGPRGETAGFPQQAPRLPRPEGAGDKCRRNQAKRENSDVTPYFYQRRAFPVSLFFLRD